MSTILDALRKVERERESSPDLALETPPTAPEVRRRRTFPVTAIILCALIGFAGGAVLSWRMPEEPEMELAALPVPPPPPAIPVPRAPLVTKPLAPMQAEAPSVKAENPGSGPAAAEVPRPEPPREAPAAAIVAAAPPGPAVADALRPIPLEQDPGEALAALDKHVSALEPSPFGAPRETGQEIAPPGEAPTVAPPVGVRGEKGVPSDDADGGLAAVAPPAPATPDAPPVEAVPDLEPEPETPAETFVDTGRSPPGAPKVALSFLQWSAEPARRFAFISIDGAPTQRVHEGEVAAGLTVAAITPTGVQFKREGTSFVIRPRH
jgi:hypothetical protein